MDYSQSFYFVFLVDRQVAYFYDIDFPFVDQLRQPLLFDDEHLLGAESDSVHSYITIIF